MANDIPYLKRDGLHSQNLSNEEVKERSGVSVASGRITIVDVEDNCPATVARMPHPNTCGAPVGAVPANDDSDNEDEFRRRMAPFDPEEEMATSDESSVLDEPACSDDSTDDACLRGPFETLIKRTTASN